MPFLQRKCDMYWPKDEGSEVAYGQIEVQLEREEVMANYTVRTMKIRNLKVRDLQSVLALKIGLCLQMLESRPSCHAFGEF